LNLIGGKYLNTNTTNDDDDDEFDFDNNTKQCTLRQSVNSLNTPNPPNTLCIKKNANKQCSINKPTGPENVFKQLDEICPAHTILASNTSSISITKIASVTKRPEQVIGMHFMNPVPVMKLVEVIRGYATSNETTSAIMSLSKELGKEPVEVQDYPGFVANRILMPMINEAIYTLYEGVAGVAEIDTVMKLGMAHPMGPLQLADFIGLDVCLSILRVLHDGFGNPKYAPCPLLVNMVEAGYKGVKTGEGFYCYPVGTKDYPVSSRFSS
jgi:3-hydroxybutyryl-CoA dehydrogenase